MNKDVNSSQCYSFLKCTCDLILQILAIVDKSFTLCEAMKLANPANGGFSKIKLKVCTSCVESSDCCASSVCTY